MTLLKELWELDEAYLILCKPPISAKNNDIEQTGRSLEPFELGFKKENLNCRKFFSPEFSSCLHLKVNLLDVGLFPTLMRINLEKILQNFAFHLWLTGRHLTFSDFLRLAIVIGAVLRLVLHNFTILLLITTKNKPIF